MRLFRNKQEAQPVPESENPQGEKSLDVSDMSLTELRAELARVQDEIERQENIIQVLFQGKMKGTLDDGSYNIETSAIGMKLDKLARTKDLLLTAIDVRISIIGQEMIEKSA